MCSPQTAADSTHAAGADDRVVVRSWPLSAAGVVIGWRVMVDVVVMGSLSSEQLVFCLPAREIDSDRERRSAGSWNTTGSAATEDMPRKPETQARNEATMTGRNGQEGITRQGRKAAPLRQK